MMRGNKAVALFGGALFSAGVQAAPEFSLVPYGSNEERGFFMSYSYGGETDTIEGASGSGPFTTSSEGTDSAWGTSGASAVQFSSYMEASATWAGDGTLGLGYALADIVQWFQVTEDAFLTISWQSARTEGIDTNLDFSLGRDAPPEGVDPILAFDSASPSGSLVVGLEAGILYRGALSAGGNSIDLPDAPSLVRFELTPIPAPGVSAVFAIAGLAGCRRRRAYSPASGRATT